VALSLIMALLQFKPAPMYILDEIDAALDLSHTQHIGTLFRNRFRGSQFVVVSLKEGLFTNANVLFRTRFRDNTSIVEVRESSRDLTCFCSSIRYRNRSEPRNAPIRRCTRQMEPDQVDHAEGPLRDRLEFVCTLHLYEATLKLFYFGYTMLFIYLVIDPFTRSPKIFQFECSHSPRDGQDGCLFSRTKTLVALQTLWRYISVRLGIGVLAILGER
jgi:hypothetical protein